MSRGLRRLQREESFILALLREEYKCGKKILNEGSLKEGKLVNLMMRHWIAPTLLKRIHEHYKPHFSRDFLRESQLFIMAQINKGKAQKDEIKHVSHLLKDNAIPSLLMKGPVLNREVEPLRVSSDMDILIKDEDLEKTISLLEKEGYQYKGSFILSRKEKKDIQGQLSWNNQYQFKSPRSQITLEIHNNLFERDRIRLEGLDNLLDRIDLFWERSEWCEELGIQLPSREASLALICLHCSLKRSPGENRFVLRHMLDMETLFLKGIDRERFIFLCRQWHIAYYGVFAMKLYERFMGPDKTAPIRPLLSEQENILDRRERILIKVHLSCVRHLRNSTITGRILYKICMPLALGGGLKKTMKWYLTALFPTPVEIENRFHIYGIKKESPLIVAGYILNPIQFVWRKIKDFLIGSSKPGS